MQLNVNDLRISFKHINFCELDVSIEGISEYLTFFKTLDSHVGLNS